MTAVLVSLAPLAMACGIFTGPPTCTADIRFALSITVSDAVTDEPVFGALAIAQDGLFVDSARTSGMQTARVRLGQERPGTYDVTVEKVGFATFERLGIQVDANECHVITERVNAALTPL